MPAAFPNVPMDSSANFGQKWILWQELPQIHLQFLSLQEMLFATRREIHIYIYSVANLIILICCLQTNNYAMSLICRYQVLQRAHFSNFRHVESLYRGNQLGSVAVDPFNE